MVKSVLLAGETWTSTATHINGFDQFPTVTYHNGATTFLDCLSDSDYRATHMPSHQACTGSLSGFFFNTSANSTGLPPGFGFT